MDKAVTFDLWNTILCDRHYGEHRVDALERALKEEGIIVDKMVIRNSYQSALICFNELWESDRKHQYISAANVIEFVLKSLNVSLSIGSKSEAVERFEEAILHDPPPLREGTRMVLKKLHNRYRIGLISNTGITPGRILRRVLEHHTILRYFACTIFSDEVGFTKPCPVIFRKAINALQVNPAGAIHIGDLLETDVAGAKAIGMKTVWLNDAGTDLQRNDSKTAPDHEIRELSQLPRILHTEKND